MKFKNAKIESNKNLAIINYIDDNNLNRDILIYFRDGYIKISSDLTILVQPLASNSLNIILKED